MNGIERIQNHFATQKAFVAYLTAGDGGIARSLEMARALIAGGVNMIEIGVPFSEPVADGPVIQRAVARALSAHISMKDILVLVAELRAETEIPIILFSYLNPILRAHAQDVHFWKAAQKAGVDGLLVLDAPVDAAINFHAQCITHGIAPIYMITPTTPESRLAKINEHGSGFLYYACRKGVTGVQNALPKTFASEIQIVRSHISYPVIVGFGISNRTLAQAVLEHAEGVVVGSLFVDAISSGISADALTKLTQSINPLEEHHS